MSRSPKRGERPQKAEATAWLRKGTEAHQAGRLSEAQQCYEAVLTTEPRQFDAQHLLGVVLGQQGQLQEGIQRVRSALRIKPQSPDALVNLGELLRRNNDTRAAVRAFETALGRGPRYDAYMNLGLVFLAEGQYAAASSNFGAACGLRPDQADCWNNLGLAWQGQKRFRDALFAYERAHMLNPKDLNALVNIGNMLAESGETDKAIQYYHDALAINPDAVVALFGLARSQQDAGDVESIATMQHAVALAPDRADLHQTLGACFIQWGRFNEAFESFRIATKCPNRSGYAALLNCRKIQSQPQDLEIVDEAVALLKRTDLSIVEQSSLCFGLGKASNDLGQYEQAVRYFDRANELARAWHRFDREHHSKSTDQMISTFNSATIGRCKTNASQSVRPIFIVGMPRSGTTLVEQILASHSEVAPGGELRFWGRQGMSRVLRAVESGDLTDLHHLQQRYLEILDLYSATTARVTDKMPDNFLGLGPIHALFPDARIVHCRRDPVDVALSNYFTIYQAGQDWSYDRNNIVFFYREYLRIMAHWRSVLPADRLLEIDYAEMVTEPELMTRRIVAFCGLEWDEACLAPHRTQRPILTASAWQARQPVYQSSLNRWRHYEPWLGVFRDLWGESNNPSLVATTVSVNQLSVQAELDPAR